MKLAFITTTNSLDIISSLGDIEFCLAPYAVKDEKYKEYFINAKKQGRHIIIDNGIAEDIIIPTKTYVQTAINMEVSEIIIPDKIGDYLRSKRMRELFLKQYYPMLKEKGIKIQGVVQGDNLAEYWLSFKELNEDKRIDVIGIPFRMNYASFSNVQTKEENCMLNRIMFIEGLGLRTNKEIHLLGCNTIIEILVMSQMNIARSMDSKLLARYGLNDLSIKPNDNGKPKKKLFVDMILTNKQINKTLQNIRRLKKWLIN